MAYFEGVEVGDEVESVVYGKGSVVGRQVEGKAFVVDFEVGTTGYFNLDGRTHLHQNQTLFYPGVKVIPPKRTVMKEVTIYANVYHDCVVPHTNKGAACGQAVECAIAVAIPCVGKYPVEVE